MTAIELQKMAEALKSDHPATTLGKSLAGLGVGAGLGYGLGKGVDYLTRGGVSSSSAAKFLPIVGGALGMAAPYFHQMTVQKMQEGHRERQEAKDRGRSNS